ncbi:MAG TPA: exosortase B [Rhodocyclaceae bacterium]
MLGAGLAALYAPTLWDFAHGIWASDTQAHGPMILALASWLIWRARGEILAVQAPVGRKAMLTGWTLLAVGLMFYLVGRSQSIEYFELGSLIWVLAGAVLVTLGPRSLKTMWFPLFFMLFMIPLPGLLVAAVTMPMKIAVSYVAETVLHGVGYPIARTGVIMQIGQYQLLVADACAGLHTLFTLEALGLLYLNVARHESVMRNVALAILIIPISFTANVIRVMVLSLITYHFGDEAGQGFLHGFAGMVLFLAALILIVGVDSLLRALARRRAAPVALGA